MIISSYGKAAWDGDMYICREIIDILIGIDFLFVVEERQSTLEYSVEYSIV